MKTLAEELRWADARGVAPPQNWTTRAADELEQLRTALLDLYNGTAEYVYLNNLGDPHNTTPMRRAAEVLGVSYPRSLKAKP